MKGLFENISDIKIQISIVCELLSRLSDEEKSVQDLAHKSLCDCVFYSTRINAEFLSLDELSDSELRKLTPKAEILASASKDVEFPRAAFDKLIRSASG